MVRHYGGHCLQIRKAAAKQKRTDDRRWFSSLGVVRVIDNNASQQEHVAFYEMVNRSSYLDRLFGTNYVAGKKNTLRLKTSCSTFIET